MFFLNTCIDIYCICNFYMWFLSCNKLKTDVLAQKLSYSTVHGNRFEVKINRTKYCTYELSRVSNLKHSLWITVHKTTDLNSDIFHSSMELSNVNHN